MSCAIVQNPPNLKILFNVKELFDAKINTALVLRFIISVLRDPSAGEEKN